MAVVERWPLGSTTTLKKPSNSKWLQKKGSSKSLRGVMCLNSERSHK